MQISRVLFVITVLLCSLGAQAGEKLLTVRSPQNFDATLAGAQSALQQQGFTVAHIQKCDGGLNHMGYETDDYKIIFFGRLDEVRELSKTHPQLIPLFPFKLAVYAEGEETLLSVVNPAELVPLLAADATLQAKLQAWEEDFRQVLERMRQVDMVQLD